MRAARVLPSVLGLLWLESCAPQPEAPGVSSTPRLEMRAVDPPAAPGSLAAALAVVDGSLAATWLEPVGAEETSTHRLRFSRLVDGRWLEPTTVVEGRDFFANWADLPGAVETGGGELLAHWLAKTAEATYAYSVFLARSADGGQTWEAFGKLNDDDTPTEHGFVSWVAEADGARAFWLDGRAMVSGGAMSLRTARVGREIGPETVLDERVCECCSTSAALGARGPIVVYRDRSVEEVRDVVRVRSGADGWGAPATIHVDGWRIEGCPVNGPEIAAAGERIAVAWFTAANGRPVVKLALSGDGGASFGHPLVVDDEVPVGRVDVALAEPGEVWISWLSQSPDEGELRLQRRGRDGALAGEFRIATTSAGRTSGVPRLERVAGSLFLLWGEVRGDEPRRLRLREIPLAQFGADG